MRSALRYLMYWFFGLILPLILDNNKMYMLHRNSSTSSIFIACLRSKFIPPLSLLVLLSTDGLGYNVLFNLRCQMPLWHAQWEEAAIGNLRVS